MNGLWIDGNLGIFQNMTFFVFFSLCGLFSRAFTVERETVSLPLLTQ